ncbi:hypothetical protein ACFOUP_12705 [Belliella kenyensis]|uniref:Uncharacterized protein n=1 Tax=Belliella kenyensis TaxID=1472724 RepID=A0ABV8EPH1_9BACT|nr:hypothetical protein [Belliella kenyensis]MCH7400834.1 hypothetical protein [Belliella kenyensis]MDN3601878.1 hypothetical protein [Belliella kenyensis]
MTKSEFNYGKNSFVKPAEFALIKNKQIQETTSTLEEYFKKKAEDIPSKLQYYFFSDSNEKIVTLGNVLLQMKNHISFDATEDSTSLFVVIGEIDNPNLSIAFMIEWTNNMCELGFKHDCEFGGWELIY